MSGFRSRFPTVTPQTTDLDLPDIVFRPCFIPGISTRAGRPGQAAHGAARTGPAGNPAGGRAGWPRPGTAGTAPRPPFVQVTALFTRHRRRVWPGLAVPGLRRARPGPDVGRPWTARSRAMRRALPLRRRGRAANPASPVTSSPAAHVGAGGGPGWSSPRKPPRSRMTPRAAPGRGRLPRLTIPPARLGTPPPARYSLVPARPPLPSSSPPRARLLRPRGARERIPTTPVRGGPGPLTSTFPPGRCVRWGDLPGSRARSAGEVAGAAPRAAAGRAAAGHGARPPEGCTAAGCAGLSLPSRSRNSGAGGLSRVPGRITLSLSRLVSAYPARPSQRLLTQPLS